MIIYPACWGSSVQNLGKRPHMWNKDCDGHACMLEGAKWSEQSQYRGGTRNWLYLLQPRGMHGTKPSVVRVPCEAMCASRYTPPADLNDVDSPLPSLKNMEQFVPAVYEYCYLWILFCYSWSHNLFSSTCMILNMIQQHSLTLKDIGDVSEG